jgi:hypothetical protein
VFEKSRFNIACVTSIVFIFRDTVNNVNIEAHNLMYFNIIKVKPFTQQKEIKKAAPLQKRPLCSEGGA